jgi:small-conductance mechanosensitive channel
LQTFALSLTAFAVAFVVATKEMILCLTGSLFRISTQPYKVGDWITIDGTTGEVMEINAFNTRLEELDVSSKSYQFTGKSVMMPNSKLFTSTVENQNFIKSFIFHDFWVAVQFNGMNPVELSEILQDVTNAHVAPFRDDAVKFARRVSRKAGIDLPEAKPSFGFRTTELGHYIFSGRVFVPTKKADDVGVAIVQEFLGRVHELRMAANEEEPAKSLSIVE